MKPPSRARFSASHPLFGYAARSAEESYLPNLTTRDPILFFHMPNPRQLSVLLAATLFINPLLATESAAPKPGPTEKLDADGLALVRTWVPPTYPPAELKAKKSGMVTVRFIVDETGRVTRARALEDSDAAFAESAVAAVKSWGFTPATEAGHAVACCLETLVAYSPTVGQQKVSAAMIPPERLTLTPAPRTSPVAKVAPPGDYPDVLVERKLPGKVRFKSVVTVEGRAIATRITGASHVEFVLPALRALEQWEFQPAQQGDLAVRSPVEGLVTFDEIIGKPEEILEANGITAPDGTPPPITPMPSFMVDPVMPLEPLLAGEKGSATVEFRVMESGAVRDVKVREATRPEYGEALAAAVESWGFDRPIDHNRAVAISLLKHAEFKAIPLDAASVSDPLTRVVLAMRRGEIHGAKGLDQKLAPIYGVRPDYPAALKAAGGPAGRAEIDVVIDRDGRVRLPRVSSATQAEFGWAAATAVAQWVFTAPRRGGEPVDVKARIPFEFAALDN